MSQQNMELSDDMDQPDGEFDYAQLTPYDVMRLQNCKSARFLNKETYPNIRPPVSRCSNEQTKTWLADAVEGIGCRRPFDTRNNDILELWKQTPNKQTLSCYGLGSHIYAPDAVVFNQALIKSLNKVNGVNCKCKRSKKASQKREKKPKPKGAYLLNRNVLQHIINKMPTVITKANASAANSVLYCPHPETEYPFMEDEPIFPLQRALDMEKPVRKPRHGLRRKHKYCELQCCIPENKCTDYEWRKYKQDPDPYHLAFEKELDAMEVEHEVEPGNFDELYSSLMYCFEKNNYEIPECEVYGKCCRRPSERKVIQGCGEHKIFGPFDKFCHAD